MDILSGRRLFMSLNDLLGQKTSMGGADDGGGEAGSNEEARVALQSRLGSRAGIV